MYEVPGCCIRTAFVPEGTAAHSKEYLEDPMLNTAITHLKEGEWLRDIGDGITLYDKYWTELKTIR